MHGIFAAVPTPIDPTGKPILDLFISHCNWVLHNGCDGINILGSTGEANSFDIKTRKNLMSIAARELNLTHLMVGTGTPSLSETLHLTEFADTLGFRVALVLPPYYYKPVDDQGLFSWYKTLHSKLGNRRIKIYFYNFPQLTGVNLSTSIISSLNQSWPQRFCGIKDSSGDLSYCKLLAKNKDFRVFPSSEVSISEAFLSNFSGCISATANQTSPLCATAWQNKQNEQTELINKIKVIRDGIASEALVPSIKFLIGKRTGEKSWSNVVPPLHKISKRRMGELENLEKVYLKLFS